MALLTGHAGILVGDPPKSPVDLARPVPEFVVATAIRQSNLGGVPPKPQKDAAMPPGSVALHGRNSQPGSMLEWHK
ncbi:hypothetical protein [Methylobacterium sp. 10]|uniref:hypothetical protein n=1 Tax=Methylobacterium sp. 10 TaxID=1101191 RepID=UPI0004B15919|nr:hypothetical protein [Methylobacterium sp. 10]